MINANGRDCVHGHLARNCEICEMEREVDELTAANEQLVKLLGQITVHRDSLVESLNGMPYPSEWEELRSALKVLVETEPLNYSSDFDDTQCAYCDAGAAGQPKPFIHEPTCPWLVAKTLLENPA